MEKWIEEQFLQIKFSLTTSLWKRRDLTFEQTCMVVLFITSIFIYLEILKSTIFYDSSVRSNQAWSMMALLAIHPC